MDTANNKNNNNKTPIATTIQHVTKKSSDELLRKFAEMGDDDQAKKLELIRVALKRRKRKTRRDHRGSCYNSWESPSSDYSTISSNGLVERWSLLPPVKTRKSALLNKLGIGRSQLKARDIKNKSILASIEKTWRKTLEGASRILLEKHYNQHRRLINDMV